MLRKDEVGRLVHPKPSLNFVHVEWSWRGERACFEVEDAGLWMVRPQISRDMMPVADDGDALSTMDDVASNSAGMSSSFPSGDERFGGVSAFSLKYPLLSDRTTSLNHPKSYLIRRWCETEPFISVSQVV
jgi:hypothetical protein